MYQYNNKNSCSKVIVYQNNLTQYRSDYLKHFRTTLSSTLKNLRILVQLETHTCVAEVLLCR